ncbi:hypothetical protein [Noviherbaspirillum galbum]|uniref:TonB C-terminal domain-containing protein n=1 Tax=Noviherbaspirillum galbum TaxID=2709383 RepID=A0A6B3SXQ5_9BURK|nr:hypothetical protein [Noviherbaspirillum galbum]NEX63956.1 hypothetical protein [Noviherbaspirillum galbum]
MKNASFLIACLACASAWASTQPAAYPASPTSPSAAPSGTSLPSFDERAVHARSAEGDERYHPYPASMLKQAGPQIARLIRRCGASAPNVKPFALVADIDAHGHAQNILAKPEHASARCFAKGFGSLTYLKPPVGDGQETFPVMVRVGHLH